MKEKIDRGGSICVTFGSTTGSGLTLLGSCSTGPDDAESVYTIGVSVSTLMVVV
jgi:hypothetical protein